MGTLAKRVAHLRTRKGLSAKELGERLTGMDVRWDRFTVANLESGKRKNVTLVEWLALARALDVSPLHLLIEPEAPGAPSSDAAAPYQITPDEVVPREQARAWVRGMSSLPHTDLSVFYSEMPAEEWGNVWLLTQKPAEAPEGLRRAYAGFGSPQVVERGGGGEHR